ncbi:glutamyl-prolyl-tRNA synthetase [Brevipalpus obovatus]|uniref:glutamyl-prolyl-tRNA synthetase n=1 Tax=Brevipalpus obovatus TaxID=246614 RepID=UPI003D9F7828
MAATGIKGDDTLAKLPGDTGNVVVRFPPEASGYLHIGHAKAALLNQRYQIAYNGKLVFRFDDTNPDKEKTDFEDVIRGDVAMLEIKPDICSYTSDHFRTMLEKCEDLLRRGLAYVDDTPADQMKAEREQRTESKNRNNPVEKNLSLWEEMKKGTDIGKTCCVRAKIDMSSNNGCLRDPTIYRCKEAFHPRTKDTYKVYPTYDFACPIVDCVEGVTHAMRTTEYEDRDEQYAWFLNAMNLRKIHIFSYARLNMMNTVLSKRKLTWFVDQGVVDGWDDPRMPTVRGILRRGMTIEGLKQFINAQGSSRSVVFMDWDKIWSFNRKILDNNCIRLMCIQNDNPVTLNLDCQDGFIQIPAHPKRYDLGNLQVPIGPKILIEQSDAQLMKEGDKVTLMGWGNVQVAAIQRDSTNKITFISGKVLDDKDFKKTLKISWLKAGATIEAKFVYYEHIILKPVLGKDDDFKDFVNKDSVRTVNFLVTDILNQHLTDKYFQFLKRGYFIIDSKNDSKPLHLISIPDGSTDLNVYPESIQEWKKKLREEAARLSKDVPTGKTKKSANESPLSADASKILSDIQSVGDEIRSLKANKADKSVIDDKVKTLLGLKAKYKEVTGQDWTPPATSKPAKSKDSQPQVKKEAPAKSKPKPKPEHKAQPTQGAEKPGTKKQSRLGLEARKDENLADWYTEVITKSEMIEYYDISGCYILRPWAYAIWETIQKYMDGVIKSLGVENCYFPMFVSQSALEREKTHIADFSPEVAWVTKSGSSEMPEPIAIRPTSETVMYPSFAKWCQSHRSLPIKVNQWCNIVRWEFKNPTPFLRTREFLWQEGHTAYANKEDAVKEVYRILDLYASVYEHLLAIPVIKGKKSEKEKFAGGDFTTTIEAFVSTNGRGIQAATSHHLGQNFSKMFGICFESPNEKGKVEYAYQNSWGLTTRSIGTMIMIHSDDRGLVLPPNVSPIQVVIVPCGITAATTDREKEDLLTASSELEKTLSSADIRCKLDDREHYTPGWRYNHWELKGVPIRIEIGPKDLANQQYVAVRRDTANKNSYKLENVTKDIKKILEDIQNTLFMNAKKIRDERLKVVTVWDKFMTTLDQKCIILAPFCGDEICEETIKKNSTKVDATDTSGPLMGAKTLCLPFEQPRPIEFSDKCINPHCNSTKELQFALFGRSY